MVRVCQFTPRHNAVLLTFHQLTNEFKFSIAAFHHGHETYLVPDLLKKAYGSPLLSCLNIIILTFIIGGPPAIALFATNARYKREAYRGSEFAPAILADNDLKVVMKVSFSIQYIVPLTFVSFRVIIPS